MEAIEFYNNQLQFDLERLLSYDKPFESVKRYFDESQEIPMYVLDISDNSYFYDNAIDRDMDMKKYIIMVGVLAEIWL